MSTTKGIGLCRTEREYTFGTTRIATDEEARLGIQAKLLEECGEVIKAPKDISEYADAVQVLFDMANLNGITRLAILSEVKRKFDECGGFMRLIDGEFLIWEPN